MGKFHFRLVQMDLYNVNCFAGQFDAMKDELERRRDECIQLRTMLSARSRGMSEVADESYGGNPNILNEDGELEMAYKTQKDLNK